MKTKNLTNIHLLADMDKKARDLIRDIRSFEYDDRTRDRVEILEIIDSVEAGLEQISSIFSSSQNK